MGSPTNKRRRWPGLLLLFAVIVVVAEIVTYPTEIASVGRLDMAKNAEMVQNWTKSIHSPSSASPSLSTSLVLQDEEDGRCQEWLEAEDNVSYSRNFEKDPVLIAGSDQDWSSCTVGCKFGFPANKIPDATFGLAANLATETIHRSMESSQYYIENNIDLARRWVHRNNLTMDKKWMREPRHSKTYVEGMKYLLDLFYAYKPIGEKCPCPYKKCVNIKMWDREEVEGHLVWNGIMENYTEWIYHDGRLSSNEARSNDISSFTTNPIYSNDNFVDPMDELLRAAIPNMTNEENVNEQEILNDHHGEDETFVCPQAPVNLNANDLYTTFLEENKPLWEGCQEYTKLSFLLKLLHIKTLGNWSNTHFSMLLKVLQGAVPGGYETIPSSYYEAKKISSKLGHNYIKIDACEDDCSLFWGIHKNDSACYVCGKLRWIETNEEQFNHMLKKRKQHDMSSTKKIGKKVFRYFPLKERLERLYQD